MKKCSVLFIGNSYTYYNEMPTKFFKEIGRQNGIDIEVTSIVKGGWTLEKHADTNDEYGAQVALALDEKNVGKYDYVILQEQSLRPARDDGRELFFVAVRELVKKIRAIGATPVLYSTWGRRRDHQKLVEFGFTHESMMWRLASAYGYMGRELDVAVANVGFAFGDIYRNHEAEINLYHTDGTHPSPVGSFVASLTLYSKIFGVDVRTLTLDFELDEEVVKIIREAVYNAVFNAPSIPEEYKINS